MERKLNLNAVDYAKNGTLESDYFDPAEYNYKTSVMNMSERFVKELARAHDACKGYGQDHYEGNTVLNEMDPEDWWEGNISGLVIMENDGEPGDDFIVVYNYEGVMRMTGIMADSHCHIYIYKLNQT
jgi:hypothetical protein